jgi:hypothetical protein
MGGNLKKYDPIVVNELIKSTCMSIPSKHREDERDPFNDPTKDKFGKPKPRVNVQALKEFFKKQLTSEGFKIQDKLEDQSAGFTRQKKNNGRYNYSKIGKDGKKVVLTVPGTLLPPTVVPDVAGNFKITDQYKKK